MAFFRELPVDLEDAARVDGATTIQAFRKVIVPLAAPGVFTTAILTFIYAWNEFLFANTFIFDAAPPGDGRDPELRHGLHRGLRGAGGSVGSRHGAAGDTGPDLPAPHRLRADGRGGQGVELEGKPLNKEKFWARDLEPGSRLRASFATDSTVRKDSRGVPYLSLKLVDRTGSVDARMWGKLPEEFLHETPSPAYVEAEGHTHEYRGTLQVKLERLRLLRPEDVSEKTIYLPLSWTGGPLPRSSKAPDGSSRTSTSESSSRRWSRMRISGRRSAQHRRPKRCTTPGSGACWSIR